MRVFNTIIVAICVCLTGGAVAQVRDHTDLEELLIPVDESEIARIQRENDYFIKSRLYFAKRHRFVRVDHTVLENSDIFQISLFPDKVLTVSKSKLEIEQDSLISWRGQIEDPVLPLSGIHYLDMTDDQVADFHHQIHRLNLVGVNFDYEPATGRSFASRSEKNIQGFRRPSDGTLISKSAFYGFEARFSVPSFLETYKLSSLEVMPDIHLVYEVDDSKFFPHEPTTNPKYESRRQRHKEFVETLGENPQDSWAARHTGEIE